MRNIYGYVSKENGPLTLIEEKGGEFCVLDAKKGSYHPPDVAEFFFAEGDWVAFDKRFFYDSSKGIEGHILDVSEMTHLFPLCETRFTYVVPTKNNFLGFKNHKDQPKASKNSLVILGEGSVVLEVCEKLAALLEAKAPLVSKELKATVYQSSYLLYPKKTSYLLKWIACLQPDLLSLETLTLVYQSYQPPMSLEEFLQGIKAFQKCVDQL